MATLIDKVPCEVCTKKKGTKQCPHCSKWLCEAHLGQHTEKLKKEASQSQERVGK